MLLEAREGQAATIPIDLFKAGLRPSDADLQRFYGANRARYTVPEQRVIRFARHRCRPGGERYRDEQEIRLTTMPTGTTMPPRTLG
jgi:peptidyl-prolyl cis-trans isomerase D